MVASGQRQAAGNSAAEIANGPLRVLDFLENQSGPWVEDTASLSQATNSADTIKQANTSLAFEQRDTFADRWLGQM